MPYIGFDTVGGPRDRSERSKAARLAVPMAVLVFFVLVGAFGYWLIEGWSWQQAVYMTLIVISTVGMNVGAEVSYWGQMWTLFIVVGGIASGAVVLSLVVAMVVEGQVRGIFGRRQLDREIKKLSNHVIVCGYGRMGSLVSEELRQAGEDVVVVETDSERTAAAERAGLLYVLGDAHREETLSVAGLTRAGVLVVTLEDDAANVFVTLSAHQANPKLRIIARAHEAATEGMLLKAGASRVICPQLIGASRMADVVMRPAVVDFVEMAHRGIDLEMDQLQLGEGSELAGKTLRELELPRKIGAVVVAVRRGDGSAVYHPTPELKLAAGDTLVVVGRRGAASAVSKVQTEQVEGEGENATEKL